ARPVDRATRRIEHEPLERRIQRLGVRRSGDGQRQNPGGTSGGASSRHPASNGRARLPGGPPTRQHGRERAPRLPAAPRSNVPSERTLVQSESSKTAAHSGGDGNGAGTAAAGDIAGSGLARHRLGGAPVVVPLRSPQRGKACRARQKKTRLLDRKSGV